MKRVLTALAAAFCSSAAGACAQEPEPPAPPKIEALAPAPDPNDPAVLKRRADFAEAMRQVDKRQLVFNASSEDVSLEGALTQGGLVFGKTLAGAKVRLDGEDVMVGDDGRFVIGFGRDAAPSSLLAVTLPDGKIERVALKIAARDFPVQRIDGLPESEVSKFSKADLEKIAEDKKLKDAARESSENKEDWRSGFEMPARGVISGVYGSQRILNGQPKSPHSGIDIAAPTGTPIRAPADGVVTLAEPDMYFEGGLVLIDHGFWVESALMHMSKVEVKAGERVKKGQEIGRIGQTGRATGPHTHWSVKWMGIPVDPQLLVQDGPGAGAPVAAGAGEKGAQ
ncbi:MAG: peptidoglycan DD-metalloendopeptidase family protein [Alphaproteobacteria bacterium]|nr:peptidoglycan DD-metalloendopeptidase family protein [Alphaproteobacteria bacterium]